MENGQYKLTTEHRITRVETKVDTILTNHLPHMDAKIDDVKGKIDNLQYTIYITFAVAVAIQFILKLFI